MYPPSLAPGLSLGGPLFVKKIFFLLNVPGRKNSAPSGGGFRIFLHILDPPKLYVPQAALRGLVLGKKLVLGRPICEKFDFLILGS